MSIDGILLTDDLKRITKLTKPGDIERVLTQQGIKVFRGRQGVIWTTMDLINHAGGMRPIHDPCEEKYSLDII